MGVGMKRLYGVDPVSPQRIGIDSCFMSRHHSYGFPVICYLQLHDIWLSLSMARPRLSEVEVEVEPNQREEGEGVPRESPAYQVYHSEQFHSPQPPPKVAETTNKTSTNNYCSLQSAVANQHKHKNDDKAYPAATFPTSKGESCVSSTSINRQNHTVHITTYNHTLLSQTHALLNYVLWGTTQPSKHTRQECVPYLSVSVHKYNIIIIIQPPPTKHLSTRYR